MKIKTSEWILMVIATLLGATLFTQAFNANSMDSFPTETSAKRSPRIDIEGDLAKLILKEEKYADDALAASPKKRLESPRKRIEKTKYKGASKNSKKAKRSKKVAEYRP